WGGGGAGEDGRRHKSRREETRWRDSVPKNRIEQRAHGVSISRHNPPREPAGITADVDATRDPAQVQASGRISRAVAPRLHPGITQEVAPNESQGAQNATPPTAASASRGSRDALSPQSSARR